MTALAIPLFMIAASRWLCPGFWLNAVVSVSLGSLIFLWSLPGDFKEAFVFDLMGVPLALAVNLFSFLVFEGFCRRTRSRDANPRQIFARGYGPEGKLAFWERPWPWWERIKADLDDPGSIHPRGKRAEEGDAS
jgi:hypothetical protein